MPPRSAAGHLETTPTARVVTHGQLLVVDDEPVIRVLMGAMLRRSYDVSEAGSVVEAQALLETFHGRYDVIISDINMPCESGLDLVVWVRRHHPRLSARVGLMTGGALPVGDQEALRRAGLPCLFKPFSLTDLRAFVSSLDGVH